MRRAVVILGVLAVIMLGYGCGARNSNFVKPTVYALPVQDGQKIGSAKYPFPASIGPGRMEVYFQELGFRRVSGYPQKSLRIQVSCENRTQKTLLFDTTESHIIDNRGDVLRCSGAWRDGASAESFEEILPGCHAQIDLFFDIRNDYPVEKLENFRVYWRYKGGDRVVAESTQFVKHPVKNMFYRDEHGRRKSYQYYIAMRDVNEERGTTE